MINETLLDALSYLEYDFKRDDDTSISSTAIINHYNHNVNNTQHKMSTPAGAVHSLRHFANLRKIFVAGVQAVHPLTLLSDNKNLEICKVSEKGEFLKIRGDSFELSGKKCHVIGFGKAVLGMAVQVEKILQNRLKSGILSVPIGTVERFSSVKEMQLCENSVIKIFEGAENNLPDIKAMETAIKIKDFAETMTNNDILFVMVTGGGSALLPLPAPLITLEEKLDVIKALVRKGASIDEVNIVRMTLSQIKGGKLAESAKGAYKVISFIIADMVHDDPDLIASGPSVQFTGRDVSPKSILQSYGIWDGLSLNIKNCIENHPKKGSPLQNNYYYVIGDNKVAVGNCLTKAKTFDYIPFVLSTRIEGNVCEITKIYTKFLKNLKRFITKEITKKDFEKNFPFNSDLIDKFTETIQKSHDEQKSLCLILAGELTVNIIGDGKGGRNQELALRMSLAIHENSELDGIYFLSAGTDGIDGPTDAAGAFGCNEIIKEFLKTNSIDECKLFLNRNDSYNFYKNLNNGKFHVITGHTGTNVMDLHLIIVPIC